jgi:hypothetical protein
MRLDKNRVVQLLFAPINTTSPRCGKEDQKTKRKKKKAKRKKMREKKEEKGKENALALPREEECPPSSYKTNLSPLLFWLHQRPLNDHQYQFTFTDNNDFFS